MSQPTEIRPQPTATRPSPDSRPRLRIRPFTWLLLAAIVGPCALVQVPREIGRWHLAAALNLRSKGDKEAAYQELAAAMARFPNNPALLSQRAEWQLQDGRRAEALADFDRLLELGADNTNVLQLHSQLLQNAGEFARAVEDWKKIEKLSQRSGRPARHDALNGLAYSQALAKVELDDALKNINEALELLPPNAANFTQHRAMLLDTRGYVLHLLGQDDSAIDDMNQAVKSIDETLLAYGGSQGKVAPLAPEESGTASSVLQIVSPSMAREAAVIHYHRALVLAALDRQDEAAAERALVRKLIGKEPDETLF